MQGVDDTSIQGELQGFKRWWRDLNKYLGLWRFLDTRIEIMCFSRLNGSRGCWSVGGGRSGCQLSAEYQWRWNQKDYVSHVRPISCVWPLTSRVILKESIRFQKSLTSSQESRNIWMLKSTVINIQSLK